MVLSIFNVINLNVFFGEISGFTAAFILGVNFYLIFSYCKMTGTPYKNRKSYLSVKWVGIVGGVWTIGFVIKFLIVLLGHSLY